LDGQKSGTALVTGASSGIGAAFARKLAAQGCDLVLVARREERLKSLANELQREHPVRAEVFPADLSDPMDIERVERKTAALGELEFLVNNAGFGVPGNFVEAQLDRHSAMIQVHVLATVRLCRAALPGMIARGRGSIVNVSSIAAFIPSPKSAVYCATKACLNAFSEALQVELAGTGVRVQALCPGLTHTEFHERPGYETYKSRIPELFWMSAEDVVTESLSGLKRGQVICVPGLKNRVAVAVARNRLGAVLLKVVAGQFRK